MLSRRRLHAQGDRTAQVLLTHPTLTDAEVARRTGRLPEAIHTARFARGMGGIRR
jgi:hypothetical protein